MSPCLNLLAVSLPTWFSSYAHWWIAGVIVIGGMLVFGMNELSRLQFRRVWAISDVCFSESLRRRVLWVTPFAILGVIAVSLLQHPVDEQEAIRQTIKFCLFASGTLVTITAIILACTNLPREIENRVIYTIVTKPTTRLEIVLGKVVGFIRLSGLIVAIMGIFTFAYLEWQNVQLSRQVAARLKTETDAGQRGVLQGYKDAGLLNTQSLEASTDLQVYSHFPSLTGTQIAVGGQTYWYAVPFSLSRQDQALLEAAAEEPPRAAVYVINTLPLKRNVPTKDERSQIESRNLPTEGSVFGPSMPGAKKADTKPKPQITVSIVNENHLPLVIAKDIGDGKATDAPPVANPDGTYTIATPLAPEAIRQILDQPTFLVSVVPETPSVDYVISPTPTVLGVFGADHSQHVIRASGAPRFGSHPGRYGMQIAGGPNGSGTVAAFRFENVSIPADHPAAYAFRFRGGIQRGGDYDAGEAWSKVFLTVLNRNIGKKTVPPIEFHPETNRDIEVPVPAEYLEGGNFDVYVQGGDIGQWVGVTHASVQLISAEHNFAVNLVKSLFILWLFSILVVIIAIFTSTFLSWPIAVVLTLGILLGHWGVDQLGDALNPGVGRSVAQDLGFGRDAAKSVVVSTSVDALAKLASAVSTVLPDLSKFPVMDDITRGVSIPARHVMDSLTVLAYYGLPMLVLSFIILKKKEVAP
jgi:ABC-type transport system involved in multi-copper enzyme maturation permease subunit